MAKWNHFQPRSIQVHEHDVTFSISNIHRRIKRVIIVNWYVIDIKDIVNVLFYCGCKHEQDVTFIIIHHKRIEFFFHLCFHLTILALKSSCTCSVTNRRTCGIVANNLRSHKFNLFFISQAMTIPKAIFKICLNNLLCYKKT